MTAQGEVAPGPPPVAGCAHRASSWRQYSGVNWAGHRPDQEGQRPFFPRPQRGPLMLVMWVLPRNWKYIVFGSDMMAGIWKGCCPLLARYRGPAKTNSALP